MKAKWGVAGIAVATLAACSTTVDMTEYGRKSSLEESVWNADRVWKRTAGDPPVYVPAGYSGPVNAEAGEWITDKRDGKRFFVPRGGADGLSEGVLRNDAYRNAGGRPKGAVTTERLY